MLVLTKLVCYVPSEILQRIWPLQTLELEECRGIQPAQYQGNVNTPYYNDSYEGSNVIPTRCTIYVYVPFYHSRFSVFNLLNAVLVWHPERMNSLMDHQWWIFAWLSGINPTAFCSCCCWWGWWLKTPWPTSHMLGKWWSSYLFLRMMLFPLGSGDDEAEPATTRMYRWE